MLKNYSDILATNLQYRRLVPIAFFGAYYGMRRSEILGLKWNAINFKKGINYISKLFGKATKAYGRPEITLHKLRHSCASMLIEKGWDPKKLQYWLGHEDISVTFNIYSHFNKQRLNTCSADLNEISNAVAELF